MPDDVRDDIGFALFRVQQGAHPRNAKPLKGFGGAGVVEIIKDHDGNTDRAVYTVRFAEMVFVLHAFQKKSRSGVATPRSEINLIKRRLKVAAQEYEAWLRSRSQPPG